MSSSTIASSVDAAGAAADSLKAGLDAYHSFKLGSATGVADGTPPTTHDSISDAASSYCTTRRTLWPPQTYRTPHDGIRFRGWREFPLPGTNVTGGAQVISLDRQAADASGG